MTILPEGRIHTSGPSTESRGCHYWTCSSWSLSGTDFSSATWQEFRYVTVKQNLTLLPNKFLLPTRIAERKVSLSFWCSY